MKYPIYPCIWFDNKAAEAAAYYCKAFGDSKMLSENPFVSYFELSGQQFMCLNGGSHFTPNPAISFMVIYENKEEMKKIWDALSEGGKALMALDTYPWSELYGWIQDKYGVSWQFFYGKVTDTGQKYSPLLMFTQSNAGRAEEAINYYSSIFPDSSSNGIMRYEEGEGDTVGFIKHAEFKLGSSVLMAMDSSGPHAFTFNEGISLVVSCDTQAEIDHYWNKLIEGGEESRCGWLKDKFGVSWQIVPSMLGKLMSDPEKGQRVMQAFMQMNKFDIATLENA